LPTNLVGEGYGFKSCAAHQSSPYHLKEVLGSIPSFNLLIFSRWAKRLKIAPKKAKI
jgi:hypothetical protein